MNSTAHAATTASTIFPITAIAPACALQVKTSAVTGWRELILISKKRWQNLHFGAWLAFPVYSFSAGIMDEMQ